MKGRQIKYGRSQTEIHSNILNTSGKSPVIYNWKVRKYKYLNVIYFRCEVIPSMVRELTIQPLKIIFRKEVEKNKILVRVLSNNDDLP